MRTLRSVFRVLGWGVVGLMVAVFLIGYAAPYLSPSRFWWTDLFAVLVPPMSLLMGGIALGMGSYGLWHRRWGRVVAAGVLLGLLVVRFGPRIEAWTPVAPADETLRLMSFNVPDTPDAEDPSIAAVSQIVRRTAPDVLALQESYVRTSDQSSSRLQRISHTLRPLLESMDYDIPGRLPSKMVFQQPVLGRVSLDSLKVHPLPPSGETEARSRFTRTYFTWRGRSAVLYNLHLHTVGVTKSWKGLIRDGLNLATWRTFLRVYREGVLRRAQQARLIRRMIEREGLPVIVAGDFNSTPHQWAYRHIAKGLQNAVTLRARGWNGTYPARYPLVRIDHVLVGPEWTVTSAQAPPLRESEAASDHRPVIVQLRWNDELDGG